ncbi:M10 family metallopeptidase C-terminal domain-containing protein [Ruegeria sp. PrR005]|uniref:Peptidase M10 serralysin C-terminal domain-containing protein n=1 Tax=Ruegeria sp. PrR005 TaxID=2706882 RepID=A0A6B2NZ51_9RHOB|nr:M10 family metallopeptidase C-terminal domain-containing protein [Ruegeria sp. PrR005]NDW47957.1 hypothetical protein [Ruegeria sp. PrR005]
MPTPVALTGNPSIDGLLWGWKWDSPNLTVSFPQDVREYTEFGYAFVENFQPFTNFQANQIINFGLNNLGVFSGLSFSGVENFGNLRFAQATRVDYGPNHVNTGLHFPGGRGSAEANPPDPFFSGEHTMGDNWFTLGAYTEPVLGSFQYAAGLLHEVGHALGLKHGHTTQNSMDPSQPGLVYPALPSGQDSQEYSVMTYRSHVGADLSQGASGQEEYPWTYMINDVAALQHMYGANFGVGTNETDTVYNFDPSTGAMTINGFSFGASYNAKILLTIWDGGGIDLFNFANFANDQTIDLRPGAFSTFSTAQLANLSLGKAGPANFARGNIGNPNLYQGDLRSLIENVQTGTGNDSLTGNQVANFLRAGGGNDVLNGGAGDDTLEGGNGNDTMDGGAGAGDEALFFSNITDTTAMLSGGVFTIISPEGTDRVTGVERFHFNDRLLSLAEMTDFAGGDRPGGTPGDDVLTGTAGNDRLDGFEGNDRLLGEGGADTLDGGIGADTLNGGDGDDVIIGGPGEGDLRDVIFAGEGNDSVDAGAGNDQVFGQGGNDTIAGGFGVDELQGQDGDDVITGSAFSDLVFGGAGDDFVNGGFGHDRINGGTGADKFFHVGASGHGSDWVQDYNAAEGDVLLFGNASATRAQFQVNFNHTANAAGERAGDDAVQEAFVIYRPTGQIMWALVDGAGQSSINLQIGSDVFDLLA